jgi:hypothetical protein
MHCFPRLHARILQLTEHATILRPSSARCDRPEQNIEFCVAMECDHDLRNRTELGRRVFFRTVPSLTVTLATGITSRPTFDPPQLDIVKPTCDMRQLSVLWRYS